MKKKRLLLPGVDSVILKGKPSRFKVGEFNYHSLDLPENRGMGLFSWVIFLVFIIFVIRLFLLEIVLGGKNAAASESNRIRLLSIEAERGDVLDRRGKILATSKRVFFLEKGDDEKEITKEQVWDLESQGLASENFEGELGRVLQKVVRDYPLASASAHVLGYTSLANEEDLKKSQKIALNDTAGRIGIEASYQEFLAGENGKKLIEVDASGKKVSILGSEDSKKGQSIKLTLDLDLQKTAFGALSRQAEKAGSGKGAVVVQNPQSGEVLALASYPSFDPLDIGKAASEKNKPMFNRAVLGNYPPGSIFKIVSSLAALEAKSIDKQTEIEDVGEFYLGGLRFPNWYFVKYGRKDGVIKIDRAIARSNDIFFYRLAEKTGLEPIRKMAILMGLGQRTGIDLPSEDFGLVPDETWKQSAIGDGWYLGDTMHLGIGQGYILTTPMQLSVLSSYMASGKLTKPYLVSEIYKGDESIKISGKLAGENLVSRESFDLVRDGMRKACQTGGTGWPFFEASYSAACKTGTAEKTLGNPHAWFVAFAPFENPQISVTVLVEDGGEGSSVAGPVAKEIMDWWFEYRN